VTKNTLKYITDALLFVDICAISVIGLLLKFVIPTGRAQFGQKYLLGLHRHEWGDLHLYLSLLLLVLLIVHLWFNWTWIVNSTRRYFGNRARYFYPAILCAWIGVLFVGWAVMQW